jgi:hypothetical protein
MLRSVIVLTPLTVARPAVQFVVDGTAAPPNVNVGGASNWTVVNFGVGMPMLADPNGWDVLEIGISFLRVIEIVSR